MTAAGQTGRMQALVLSIGIAAGALGLAVLLGWALRMAWLVQVLPGSSSMTIATAVAFLMSGAVLGLIATERAPWTARGLAAAVIVLAIVVLAEHAFGLGLGVDLPRLQDWIGDGNPNQGRMSVFTALAFVAFGAGCLALDVRRSRAGLYVATAGAWFVIAVGTLNLLGYLMRLEDLFEFMQVNRMAPHTSVGAIALGAGVAIAARARLQAAAMMPPVEQRITAAAIALLAVAALVSGGAVFALMQRNLEQSSGVMLLNMLEVRRQLLLSLVSQRQAELELIVAQPHLHRALRASDATAVTAAVSGFIGPQFSGLAVLDAQGRELARAGRFAERIERRGGLSGEGDAEILSSGKDILLRTRTPMDAGGGALGSLVAEQLLAPLVRIMAGEGAYGATGETVLCHGGGNRLWCFPQRLNPAAFDVARLSPGGARLPMAYALDGETGIVRTRDYRKQNVLAAYGPVGERGLGMVVKVDTAELFAPVRARLGSVLLAALATVMLGAWLLRRSVHPLAMQLAAAESVAREARAQLQKITDNVPALVGYVDAQQRYRFTNRAYADWFGLLTRDMLGRRMEEVWDAARYATMKPYVERALRGEVVEFDAIVDGSGTPRVVHTSYVPDWGPDETVRGAFVLSSDVTEITQARVALDAAVKRLDLALDASRVTVWESDLRTGEVMLSEAWAQLLDRPRGETRTTVAELSALVHPEDLEEISRLSMEVIQGKRDSYAVEHRVRAASGHWKWIISRGRVTGRDPVTGHALRMMGTNLDITARKQDELRLEQLANYDTLTGAANRNLFRDRLAQAIARCRRSKGRAALMYLDIDKFKGINDTLGHAAGDALLKEFAARLKACVRATDTVGRLGGDEFAVLLEEVTEEEAPGRIAQKILEAMRQPVDAGGSAVVVTTSIGLALFGADAEAEALAKRADAALYEAKAAGRDTYRTAA